MQAADCGRAAADQTSHVRTPPGRVGLRAADGDYDVVAVTEIDVGPAEHCDLAAAEGAVEQQGDDRTVDQAAALGGFRALKAASGAARAEAGGEDGGAIVGGEAAAGLRVGRGRSPEPLERAPRVEVMADIVTSAVSAGSPVHQSGHRGRAAQDIASFITHRLPSPDIRTVTIGVRRGAAVAGGKMHERHP